MERDEIYKEKYTDFKQETIEHGYAEFAPSPEPEGRTYYIPHHGVFHPQKKDNIRVVFDCSTKVDGTSLNDKLLKGPDLINALIGVLIRFRLGPIAYLGDMEKIFYQFRVPEDRNLLRFFWWPEGDLTQKPVPFRMKVHLFGAASSPACANYGIKHLATTNEDKLPEGSHLLLRNTFK